MILFELTNNNERDPIYQDLEVANGNRQYDFLKSTVHASIAIKRPFLSGQIVKALNYHAIVCLHTHAGEYRPCQVKVGDHTPPPHHSVDALMEDFINMVNRSWEQSDPVAIAAFVLWRLNFIHPFVNGNGRTARAACYFVLCLKVGGWLPGSVILPELIRQERPKYVEALRAADETFNKGQLDITKLHELLSELLKKQVGG